MLLNFISIQSTLFVNPWPIRPHMQYYAIVANCATRIWMRLYTYYSLLSHLRVLHMILRINGAVGKWCKFGGWHVKMWSLLLCPHRPALTTHTLKFTRLTGPRLETNTYCHTRGTATVHHLFRPQLDTINPLRKKSGKSSA